MTVTYGGTLRLPQATASKNQYVTSELAASCESMQWLAVYRYGVLEAMASLSNVPVQIKVSPPSVKSNFATALAWFRAAVVATQATSTSQNPDAPMSSTGSLFCKSPPVTTRCEIAGIANCTAVGATPRGK